MEEVNGKPNLEKNFNEEVIKIRIKIYATIILEKPSQKG